MEGRDLELFKRGKEKKQNAIDILYIGVLKQLEMAYSNRPSDDIDDENYQIIYYTVRANIQSITSIYCLNNLFYYFTNEKCFYK